MCVALAGNGCSDRTWAQKNLHQEQKKKKKTQRNDRLSATVSGSRGKVEAAAVCDMKDGAAV